MKLAFVRTEKGWQRGYFSGRMLVVGDSEPISEVEARRQLSLPGETIVKVIVSDQAFRAYDVLMRRDDVKPERVQMGLPPKPEKPRRGCLMWFLTRHH